MTEFFINYFVNIPDEYTHKMNYFTIFVYFYLCSNAIFVFLGWQFN